MLVTNGWNVGKLKVCLFRMLLGACRLQCLNLARYDQHVVDLLSAIAVTLGQWPGSLNPPIVVLGASNLSG